MNERFPLAYLVPLRLLFGVILLLEGWGKLQGDWLHGDAAAAATLDRWLARRQAVRLLHADGEASRTRIPRSSGTLVTIGELAIGAVDAGRAGHARQRRAGRDDVALVRGGGGQGLVPPGNALLMAAMFLLFVVVPPGRVLGIDAVAPGRLPRWMV